MQLWPDNDPQKVLAAVRRKAISAASDNICPMVRRAPILRLA
jgi:hypothetical protein